MKIIITNAVTLNGGDYAILESIIKVLTVTYGEGIDFIVYDSHANIAAKYYPNITYRNNIFDFYGKTEGSRKNKFLRKLNRRLFPFRFILGAKLLSTKITPKFLINLFISKEEQIDFYNYATADLVVATGGTYLVENYSLQGRFFDFRFSLAHKKPLVLFTQSLGPFTKKENIQNVKYIFNRASLILLRDNASFENLKKIGVNTTKVRVCSDVVFADSSLSVLEGAKSRQIEVHIKIGISVRNWAFFKHRSPEQGMKIYIKAIAALCEYVTRNLQGEVVFISTCQAIEEYHVDDSKTAKEIFKLLSDEAKSRTIVNEQFNTPSRLKEITKGLDIIVSTRMHSAIQSLAIGVPVIPIAYEFKTIELFKKLIDQKYILDIDTIDEDQIIEVFKQFLHNLPGFRAELFRNVEKEYFSALDSVKHLQTQITL